MTADLGLAAGPLRPASAILQERARDRRFFTGMAIASLLTAFVGFAPTYYLRGLSDAPPLPTLVHVHGLLSTAWLLLFLTQASLVAAHRTDIHRRLGVAGGGARAADARGRLVHRDRGGPARHDATRRAAAAGISRGPARDTARVRGPGVPGLWSGAGPRPTSG